MQFIKEHGCEIEFPAEVDVVEFDVDSIYC